MLLRISLVVAILAGLASLYFSQTKVSEKINTLTTDLATAQTAQRTAEEAQKKAQGESKKAREELTKANQELDDTKSELAAAKTGLVEQVRRATQLSEELDTTKKERNESQQALAAYKAAGVTPDQLKELRDRVIKTTSERDTFIAENKILLRNINQLQNELNRYIGGKEIEVKLPSGLKGKVLAVDPKYDFVVLDIGGNQGVLTHGKMLVNRDGKLVAKVEITKVEPNRSIANILAGWKQTEVMEGDQVIIVR